MKKNSLILMCCALGILTSCGSDQKKETIEVRIHQDQESQEKPEVRKKTVYQFNDNNIPHDQRGLGSLADPNSYESVADAEMDRNIELYPRDLYWRRNSDDGARLGRF